MDSYEQCMIAKITFSQMPLYMTPERLDAILYSHYSWVHIKITPSPVAQVHLCNAGNLS
jgi:hypothetical protein